MKLSISNIGWDKKYDKAMYELMDSCSFCGLEIAPTRIIKDNPYDNLDDIYLWNCFIKREYGFNISSMQSIWYGRSEMIFGSNDEREFLINYTKKAIKFAEIIGCKNLVFGCPRNRNIPDGVNEEVAIDFFRTIGKYAYNHNTVIAIEANPPIYNTNFINNTEEALALVKKIDSKGVLLNLDIGSMIENSEDVSILDGHINIINHIHISEPKLKPIVKRGIHYDLAVFLKNNDYDKFVSIEVEKQEDLNSLIVMMKYIKELFG